MSPNERLNNIILERTIEYNTSQPQNSTAKESNATFEIEARGKEDQSPHGLLTCSHICHKLSHEYKYQTNYSYKRNETTHVVKTFIYKLKRLPKLQLNLNTKTYAK